MARTTWVALGGLIVLLAASAPAAAQSTLDDLIDDSCIDERTGEVRAGTVAELADVDAGTTATTDRNSDNSLDEDTVLLSIALSNNGFSGFDFDDVRSTSRDASAQLEARQDVSYDMDDVFNAIALGEGGSGGDVGVDCVADVATTVNAETSEERTVSLDEDDAFLAIALGNAGSGGGGSLDDVADVSVRESSSMSWSRDFSLDRDDVFAALVFGS